MADSLVTIDGKATARLALVAEKAYGRKPGGADAVYDLAVSHGVTAWAYCAPCDAETPRTARGACLVCGQ